MPSHLPAEEWLTLIRVPLMARSIISASAKKPKRDGNNRNPLLKVGNPEAPTLNSQDGVLTDEREEHAPVPLRQFPSAGTLR